MGEKIEQIEDEDILRRVQEQGRRATLKSAIAGLVITLIVFVITSPF